MTSRSLMSSLQSFGKKVQTGAAEWKDRVRTRRRGCVLGAGGAFTLHDGNVQ